jgi:hypothetical protein
MLLDDALMDFNGRKSCRGSSCFTFVLAKPLLALLADAQAVPLYVLHVYMPVWCAAVSSVLRTVANTTLLPNNAAGCTDCRSELSKRIEKPPTPRCCKAFGCAVDLREVGKPYCLKKGNIDLCCWVFYSMPHIIAT